MSGQTAGYTLLDLAPALRIDGGRVIDSAAARRAKKTKTSTFAPEADAKGKAGAAALRLRRFERLLDLRGGKIAQL